MSENVLPSMNDTATFICSPWDRNMVRSIGQPLNRTTSNFENCLCYCEMFNHCVNTRNSWSPKDTELVKLSQSASFVIQFALCEDGKGQINKTEGSAILNGRQDI